MYITPETSTKKHCVVHLLKTRLVSKAKDNREAKLNKDISNSDASILHPTKQWSFIHFSVFMATK